MPMSEIIPNFAEFKRQALGEGPANGQPANLIAVYRELVTDADTPVSAFAKLGGSAYSFLLESVIGGEKWGTYSFIGVSPMATLSYRQGMAEVTWLDVLGKSSARVERYPAADAAMALGDLMAQFRPAEQPGLPRFFGGAVGYFSYDVVRGFERLPSRVPDDLGLPEANFVITDLVVVFDNVRQTTKIVANAYIREGDSIEEVYEAARSRIDQVAARLLGPTPKMTELPPATGHPFTVPTRSTFTRAEYMAAVDRVKEYILAGDVFQMVLSQRFEVERKNVHPFDVYRALRIINPSPYLFHLVFPDACVTGASPEVMVRLEGDRIELRPIAGTAKRGATPEADKLAADLLLADPKECAEHVMLVDLGRNDLGRVAEIGSVRVSELMSIERYSHVLHIVSNVTAKLGEAEGPAASQGNGPGNGMPRPRKTAMDVLRATFPAGTLTGAPKIRAMEIIEELEPVRRGVYGGAVGYVSFTGNMDTAIAIRTLVTKPDRIFMQVGAGLVADSVPESEFEECVNKASAVLQAVALAQAGR